MWSIFTDCHSLCCAGYDNEGHPLLIWRSCRHEAADRDMAEMLRLITWWFQYIDANLPSDKTKITLLCDRSDYKSSNSDIEFIKAASSVLQVFCRYLSYVVPILPDIPCYCFVYTEQFSRKAASRGDIPHRPGVLRSLERYQMVPGPSHPIKGCTCRISVWCSSIH